MQYPSEKRKAPVIKRELYICLKSVAMNCLMELHHENKLIGIISHVSDLKDRIERQLVVERKQKQSVIQMI